MSTTYETEARGDPSDTGNKPEHWIDTPHSIAPTSRDEPRPGGNDRCHAMLCFESPDSAVGQNVATIARAMAERRASVHIFARREFDLGIPGVASHVVGGDTNGALLTQVHEFTRQACNAFLREIPSGSQVTLMAFEWSAVPAASLLRAIRNARFVLSLHSFERQRSDLTGEMSLYIEETELAGLREATLALCQDTTAADIARRCVPECAERIEVLRPMTSRDFPVALDRGEVKSRFQIGPTDPTLLFVGDFHEDYGPDLLIKAMPKILGRHKQARCVFVGDGELLWPLRIHSRYLLLDYAVRIVSPIDGPSLRELVYAADIVVVPSRKATPWWPIEAAWAANRPVVVTPEAAPALVRSDLDAVFVAPDEASIAAGVDRILTNPDFARSIAHEGAAKLESRCGLDKIVARIESLTGPSLAAQEVFATAEA
jgi:glycosyltransferase involved in cell wall biosynthesis